MSAPNPPMSSPKNHRTYTGTLADLPADASRDVWPFCEACGKRGTIVCKNCHAAVFCCEEHSNGTLHKGKCQSLADSPDKSKSLYTAKWPKALLDQARSFD